MLPHEDENRQAVIEAFSDDFARSKKLLDELVRFMDELLETEMSFTDPLKGFLLGTLAREIRRYRGIIALCELGQEENATSLMRAMYEGVLSMRFVFDLTIPDGEQSRRLKRELEELESPEDVSIEEFRLNLYCGKAAKTALRLAEDIGEQDSALAQDMRELRDSVPQPWSDRLHYSGLRIAQLAEYCGMSNLHDRLYYLQCHVTHANDAMSFVKRANDGNAYVQIAGDNSQMPEVFGLAAAITFYLVSSIESAIGCDADMANLLDEYRHSS